MVITAGIQSLYQRLYKYAQEHSLKETTEWLDKELLPFPYRKRELQAIIYLNSTNYKDDITDKIEKALFVLEISTE